MSAVVGRMGRGRALLLGVALVMAGGLYVTGVNPAVSQTAALQAHHVADGPGLDPGAGVWDRARAIDMPLTAQGNTYPLGGGSVSVMDVRALHDGETLFIRMQWDDPSVDDATVRAEDFADAVAVQFPADPSSSVPSVCMGQADQGVNIWQWRADTDAGVPQVAGDLHPDAYVDQYPSTDDLSYPAREVGNVVSGADGPVVTDLVAEGFGTLTEADDQSVLGQGAWDDNQWAVVVARPFASSDDNRPTFAAPGVVDTAFAVWNGAEGDRNGQKSVSSFVRLDISTEELPPAGFDQGNVLAVVVLLAGIVGVVAAWPVLVRRRNGP